jgi:hypothetical protein
MSIRSAMVGMWELYGLDPGSSSRFEEARSGKIDNLVAAPDGSFKLSWAVCAYHKYNEE